MAITIRDVAQKAGVGLGTVSRVINNSPQVSEATRARVLAAIRELNYSPNLAARRLSLGKTQIIAVIVPYFTRPSYIERLRGIQSTLAESPYDLVVFSVETIEQRNRYFRQVPRRDRADGVLIVSLAPTDTEAAQFLKSTIPVVLIDTRHPMLSWVSEDSVLGGQLATKHLIDLGHRRIAYLSDPMRDPLNQDFLFTSSRDRHKGYSQALAAAEIPYINEYIREGPHGRYEAYRLATELLALPNRPTAIFAASDTQAMGILEAAREAKLQIPEDLSVVGYDDIEVAEYLGLTTVRQMMFESGERGINLLLETMGSPPEAPINDVLPVEIVIRNTTAPPRQ